MKDESTKEQWPNYKGYRLQVIDCIKNGNQFDVSCITCGQPNIICGKYKVYCSSKVCLKERQNGDVKFDNHSNQNTLYSPSYDIEGGVRGETEFNQDQLESSSGEL